MTTKTLKQVTTDLSTVLYEAVLNDTACLNYIHEQIAVKGLDLETDEEAYMAEESKLITVLISGALTELLQ